MSNVHKFYYQHTLIESQILSFIKVINNKEKEQQQQQQQSCTLC